MRSNKKKKKDQILLLQIERYRNIVIKKIAIEIIGMVYGWRFGWLTVTCFPSSTYEKI